MSRNKKNGLDNTQRQRISDRVLILTLFVQILILVNQSVGLYTVAAQSMQASIIEPTGETLQVHIQTDTGRLNLVEKLIKGVRDWTSSYFVGGVERTNAETGITISVTGSNVASTAYVDYYIEAVPQSGGAAYRFLEGNNTAITVGGSSLSPTNQTSIENHLTAMGLSTTASHTIDYYVYVKAEATGAVSGETLTSEITYTKFDTVSYQYGTEVTDTYLVGASSDDGTYASWGWMGSVTANRLGHQGYHYNSCLRWTNIDLDKDQSLSNAYLRLRQSGDVNGVGDIDSLIYGFDEDNTATFTGKPTGRALTTAYTEWDFSSTRYEWKASPDISGVVEEIISRSGWSNGNALGVLLVDDNCASEEYFDFTAYDESGGNEPELVIQYISYESSWYPLPPMSLASLPITLNMVALTALITATVYAYKVNRRKIR